MADKNEWKKTLNLPQTEFAMKANLPQNEPKRLESWEAADLYARIREKRAGREKFVLHDGPPYANGHIHIGQGLNKTLKDFVVKSRTMMGFDSPYVPGWDCHGLPIEHKVDKELGPKKQAMSAADFRRACRQFAEKYVDVQREDFKRLGVFGNWADPYLTMSYQYEALIAEALGKFFEAGLVYKGLKPVHWCTFCQTALAEAEVEYEEHTSPSIYVRFPLVQETIEKLGLPADEPAYAVIWTTTPWTLPANLAIALRPSFEYAVVRAEGGNHIIAAELVEAVAAKAQWADYKVLKTIPGSEFEYLKYRHAFIDREGIFVLGEYVTLEQGTGLVHTAPGHGADDYLTGRRYDLPIYTPVNHRGEFTSDVEWEGRHVFRANPEIVELLKARGVLLAGENLSHQYPHCWRCKNPVIFRATEQWFISMEEGNLRGRAIEQIHKTKWVPYWGEERITGMVENRPDWCISRQRLWGVPITVLFCDQCNEQISDPEFFARVVEIFKERGADSWFELEPADFLAPGRACAKCGGASFRKELDILDVWFDSGCSHYAVLRTRPELQWPASLYLEGHDQHRGWFQASLLVGTGVKGAAPYREVITHGFVVDENGRKMSKSLGNVVSPLDVIKQHGADIFRMWVAMTDYRNPDIAIGKEIISRIAEAYRKVRNTARFLLANLSDFDPKRDTVPVEKMEAIDRWALSGANARFARCRKAYEEYEFHVVYHRMLELCTVDLSAFYLDILKDTLYAEAVDSPKRRSAQTAILAILRGLTATLAPIIPFTADEIYEFIPGREEASVHVAEFPADPFELSEEQQRMWTRLFALREAVSRVLERARGAGQIGQSLEADVVLTGDISAEMILGGLDVDLSKVFIVSHVDFDKTPADSDQSVEIEGLGRIGIRMTPARGQKCSRCWNYREEVSAEGDICDRCESVVSALSIS